MSSTALSVAKIVDSLAVGTRPNFFHKEGPITIDDIANGASNFLVRNHKELNHSESRLRSSAEALFQMDQRPLTYEYPGPNQTTVALTGGVMPYLFLSYTYLHDTYMRDFSVDLASLSRSTISKALMPQIVTLHMFYSAGMAGINPDPSLPQTADHIREMIKYRGHLRLPERATARNYLKDLSKHGAYKHFTHDVDTITSLLWLRDEGQISAAGINRLAGKIAEDIGKLKARQNSYRRLARRFVEHLVSTVDVKPLGPIPQEISRLAPILR